MKITKIIAPLLALVFLGAGCSSDAVVTPNLTKSTDTVKQMLTDAKIQFTAEDTTESYQTAMNSATISKATHLVVPAGADAFVNVDVFEYLVSDTRDFIKQMINEGIKEVPGASVAFLDVGEPKLLVVVTYAAGRDETVLAQIKTALQAK